MMLSPQREVGGEDAERDASNRAFLVAAIADRGGKGGARDARAAAETVTADEQKRAKRGRVGLGMT